MAIRRGTGSDLSASVCPSHGSSNWAASAMLRGRTVAMPGWRDR